MSQKNRKGLRETTGDLVATDPVKKAILIVMSNDTVEKLGEGVEVAIANIREILRKESR